MLAALFLSVAFHAPVLPSYDDVQKGMYQAYRSLPHFADAWEFTLQKGTDTPVHQAFSRKIDKERSEFVALIEGAPVFRQTHDGSTFGLLLVREKVYGRSTGPNKEFSASYETAQRPKLEPNSFNYYIQSYDIMFISNPTFKVESVDAAEFEGQKMRKVVSVAKREDGSATLKLTYWFEPDKWLLHHVELDGHSTAAGDFSVKGKLEHFDLDAKIKSGDFLLKPGDIEGFREVPVSEIKPGG